MTNPLGKLGLLLIIFGLAACAVGVYSYAREGGVLDLDARIEERIKASEQGLSDMRAATTKAEANELERKLAEDLKVTDVFLEQLGDIKDKTNAIAGVGVLSVVVGAVVFLVARGKAPFWTGRA